MQSMIGSTVTTIAGTGLASLFCYVIVSCLLSLFDTFPSSGLMAAALAARGFVSYQLLDLKSKILFSIFGFFVLRFFADFSSGITVIF